VNSRSIGGKWDGIDISGHIFLLLHSSLFIIEELRVLNPSSIYHLKPLEAIFTFVSGALLVFLVFLWKIMMIVFYI
jgi:uncharacterized membrane protein